ncbi:hypothetical protein KKC97_06510 [bacterium]|nr:hypothetical protein [bacterium]
MIKQTKSNTLEAATVLPLEVVEQYTPDFARSRLLTVLLQLALAGDVRAAKLYLDYSFSANLESQSGLTLEQALQIMNEQKNRTASDDDGF